MKLHNYQLSNIEYIKKRKKVGLFIHMGLGKTITTLVAIQDLLKESKVKKVLIIAPLRVCNLVWGQEVKKWKYLLPNIKIGIATGSQTQRYNVLQDDSYNVVCINRDIVYKTFNDEKLSLEFDMLVVDESTSFKNHKSMRFQALKKKSFNYVVLLSGMPTPNHLIDIWSQIYLLDKGKSLGGFYDFRNKYFIEDGFKLTLIKDGMRIIGDKIKHFCKSMKAEDYIQLPNVIYNNIKLELTKSQQKQYDNFARDFVLHEEDSDYVLHMVNCQLALMNKLMQFTSGFQYIPYENIDSQGNPVMINKQESINTLKIDALKEIIDDNGDIPYIIVYNFKHDRDIILKNIKGSKALSPKGTEAEEWLAGKFKVLLIHPKSSGFGLNLQSGGCNIIWYSLTYSAEEYIQTNARLYRQGQVKPVTITHITINNTIEHDIAKALIHKMKISSEFNNEIKHIKN